jgi:hypothetical protein
MRGERLDPSPEFAGMVMLPSAAPTRIAETENPQNFHQNIHRIASQIVAKPMRKFADATRLLMLCPSIVSVIFPLYFGLGT